MSDLGARLLSFILPLLPGLVIGFAIGRLARKALSTALLIGGAVALVLFLVGHFGGDTAAVKSWLEEASAWAGEKLTGVGQYLAAIVPTIAALGIGFKIGLGRR